MRHLWPQMGNDADTVTWPQRLEIEMKLLDAGLARVVVENS